MSQSASQIVHEFELEVQPFASYSLVIDARSPSEFAEDHIPCAVNLPVVDDEQYAEVGTLHRSSKHSAYLKGVAYAMDNIARYTREVIAKYTPENRVLVYCLRGGKRSKLWADNLRTIGFHVDTLAGGWKAYRNWVRAGLDRLPMALEFRVLEGPTGVGKTRLLAALEAEGAQVLDLEAIARHRGSLIGAMPGQTQHKQKLFDSLLLEHMRKLCSSSPVWVEAESKKIGAIYLPDRLVESMRAARSVLLEAPMSERVRLWHEDYGHFEADLPGMVSALEPIRPLVGGEEYDHWIQLAGARDAAALFERVMVRHYDPAYARTAKHHQRDNIGRRTYRLTSLQAEDLRDTAKLLIADVDGGAIA